MIDLKKEIEILKQERDYYKNILVKNKIEFKPFEYVETPKLTTTEKIVSSVQNIIVKLILLL